MSGWLKERWNPTPSFPAPAPLFGKLLNGDGWETFSKGKKGRTENVGNGAVAVVFELLVGTLSLHFPVMEHGWWEFYLFSSFEITLLKGRRDEDVGNRIKGKKEMDISHKSSFLVNFPFRLYIYIFCFLVSRKKERKEKQRENWKKPKNKPKPPRLSTASEICSQNFKERAGWVCFLFISESHEGKGVWNQRIIFGEKSDKPESMESLEAGNLNWVL